MRRGVGIWALGIAVSVVVHLGAGAGLMAALRPEPVEDQPTPESRLNVEAQQVDRSEAAEREPESEQADGQDAVGAPVDVGAVPQSAAAEIAAPAEALPAALPDSRVQAAAPPERQAVNATATAPSVAAVSAAPPDTLALSVSRPEPDRLRVAAPSVQSATQAVPVITTARASAMQVATARPTAPPAISPQETSPDPIPVALAPPDAEAATLAEPAALDLDPSAPDPVAAPSSAPRTTQAPSRPPPSRPADTRPPDVPTTTAVLAFPADGPVDPQSLDAFQSFTQPGSISGTGVRDRVSAALSVPCSRMQVIFDPDTTTLQLTGHVPSDAQRGPVLAALRAEMGTDIAVADNLLVLPEPQCAALSGIAGVGLPQSTDQITNPLIVGEDTHARAFRYVEGDPLVLDMTGADYPAYVYVDYFDADGNVIHLMPNQSAPLRRVDEKAPLRIGARNAQEEGLFVRIGPPYGQEIAAAFAASVPLYDGFRPLVEPAEPYLAWLKERVAAARDEHPDFKGEWVYFFVTTAAD